MVWIVIFHYTSRYNELFKETYPLEFENGGIIGVTFFFIISGYFFYSGILKNKTYNLIDVGKFCINKYWRLYPAYLLSITLIFLVYQFVDLTGRECSLKDFLVNSFFIYHPYSSYVDSAHWFISHLIKFQFLSSLFLLIRPSIRRDFILLFELFIFCLLICSSFLDNPFVQKLINIFSPDCFLKFLVGYNFYMIVSHPWKKQIPHLLLGLLIIGYYSLTIHWFFILTYAAITFLILQNKYIPNCSNNNPLVIVGQYSFAWYLIHQNIGFVIINKLNDWGLSHELGLLIPMAITFGMAIIIQEMTNILPPKIFAK